MSDRYRVAQLEDLAMAFPPSPRLWAPIRIHFDVNSFGVNAYSADGGVDVVPEHDEMGEGAGKHEELYVVMSGHARFVVDGEEIDAPSGSFVFVRDPKSKRSAEATEDGTSVLALGGTAGEAFQPSPWERSAEAFRYWGTEEWDKAIAALRTALEEHPQDAGVLYNLACAESRGGEHAAALDHLREAIRLRESVRESAREDPDFQAIRSQPEFAELVAAA